MAKIVMLVSEFPKFSETFITSKFLGLLSQGWDVHIICNISNPNEWQYFPELSKYPDIHRRVHSAWPHRPRWLALLLLPLVLLFGLLRSPVASMRYLCKGWQHFRWDIFRRYYLDAEIIILHPSLIHFEFGALAPERMYLKELLDCMVLVSFRGYDLNFTGLENPKHYESVWEQADMLHLLGEDLWARAQRRGCPPDMPHTFIAPGIDLVFFTSSHKSARENIGTQERPLRILSVGRLEWKKGYEYAFQAVRQLVDQQIACEYRVIGDGDYFEALAFSRDQLGLKNVIELLGAQPREIVRDQMIWADVLLHAAVSEGFCNAVIEAQAMELPVVTSDADGLGENVRDGSTGFVVPRRSADALSKKLIFLINHPTMRQQMGIAGRERAQRHFKLESQIERFNQLYHTLLEN